jgi:hypothetical protein
MIAPSFADLIRPLTMTGAGECFDLEREEILGDSFLKYVTSVKLFLTEDTILDEGHLTKMRSKIVGNKNLFHCAREKELEQAVTHEKFEPQRNWRPPFFHSVKDVEKVLAAWDCEYRLAEWNSRQERAKRRKKDETGKTDEEDTTCDHTLFHALKEEDVVGLLERDQLDDEKVRWVMNVMARKLDGEEYKGKLVSSTKWVV